MDYLERLEKSIAEFETGNEKLAKIPELINEIVKLLAEVQGEKADMGEKMAQLEVLKTQINEQASLINGMLEKEKKVCDEFITTMSSTLIQRTQEHINMYNTLSSSVSLSETSLSNKIKDSSDKVNERIDAIEKKIDNCFVKLKSTHILVILSLLASIITCIMSFIH